MTTAQNTPITQGVHHVGLTVLNLDSTRRFFLDVLNFRQVGEDVDYPAVFMHDGKGLITLWQVADPVSPRLFDHTKVIGLHHIALQVANDGALSALCQTLSRTDGVNIEFTPELLGNGPARHMICSIPGGIRMEFISANN